MLYQFRECTTAVPDSVAQDHMSQMRVEVNSFPMRLKQCGMSSQANPSAVAVAVSVADLLQVADIPCEPQARREGEWWK